MECLLNYVDRKKYINILSGLFKLRPSDRNDYMETPQRRPRTIEKDRKDRDDRDHLDRKISIWKTETIARDRKAWFPISSFGLSQSPWSSVRAKRLSSVWFRTDHGFHQTNVGWATRTTIWKPQTRKGCPGRPDRFKKYQRRLGRPGRPERLYGKLALVSHSVKVWSSN